jgi:hypothetical protein
MRRIKAKALLAALLAAALLCAAFALPGHGAGEKMIYLLQPDVTGQSGGGQVSLGVALQTQGGYQPATFRLYLLYDKDCFTWMPGATQRQGLVNAGQFGQRDATGEANKYPADIDAAQYGVLVLQWAAMPAGGNDIDSLDASTPLPLLSLGFEVKAGAPFDANRDSFLIAADAEYGYADTPYFDGIPVEGAQARVQVIPTLTAAPGITIDETDGLLYGFPASLSQPGSMQNWQNVNLSAWLTTDGALALDNTGKPENNGVTGTGSKIVVRYPDGGAVCRSYTLVVFGDLDGNGVVDLNDYAELRAMLAGKRAEKMAAGSPYRLAADVATPYGGAPDAADLEALYQAAIGKGGLR